MSFRQTMRTLLWGPELRADGTLANPPGWLLEAFGAGKTYSGKSVTPKSSMELVPVYSAVSLLSGAVATLPMIVYRDGTPRERAYDTRQWELLHNQPNVEMAADELWEIVMSHLLLWGNAVVAKIKAGDGRIAELWPISPMRCQFGRVKGRSGLMEKVVFVDGNPYTERDVLHIRGLGETGLVGLSPIQQARQMLGSALAQEEFSGRFWAGGTLVSGFLSHPQMLTDGAAEKLSKRWQRMYGGSRNAGRTPVLEEGMKYESLTMPLSDAQFIEQAKFGDLRVAQLFRIAPYMLGAATGDSLTYSTTENQGIDFVRWSLNRWLKRIEGSVRRDPEIFPPSLKLFGEFLVDALLRADAKTRYETYEIGVRSKILFPNEARAAENREPYEGGDKFAAPPAPPPTPR